MRLLANAGPGVEHLLGEVSEGLYIERAVEAAVSAKPGAEAKAVGLSALMDGRPRWDRGRQTASALRVLEPRGG